MVYSSTQYFHSFTYNNIFSSIKILYLNDSIQPIACGVQRLLMKIYFSTLASNVSLKQNVEPVLTNLEAVLC